MHLPNLIRVTRHGLATGLSMALLTASAAVGCVEADAPAERVDASPSAADASHAALLFNGRTRVAWSSVGEGLRPLRGTVFQLCATDTVDAAQVALDCALIADDGHLDVDTRPGAIAVDGVRAGRYRLVEAAVPDRHLVDVHLELLTVRTTTRRLELESPFIATPSATGTGSIGWELDTSAASDPTARTSAIFEVCVTGLDAPRPQTGWCVQVSDDSLIDADPENHRIALAGLRPGLYQVTQLSAPTGVAFDAEPRPVALDVRQQEARLETPFRMRDEVTRVSWTAVDADTGAPLSGASFRACRTGRLASPRLEPLGEVECVVVSDGDTLDIDARPGALGLAGLDLGRWELSSVRPPQGYRTSAQSVSFALTELRPRVAIETPFTYVAELGEVEGCSAAWWVANVARWNDSRDVVSQLTGLHADLPVSRRLRASPEVTGIRDDVTVLDLLRTRSRTREQEVVYQGVLTMLDLASLVERERATELIGAIRDELEQLWAERDGSSRELEIERLLLRLSELDAEACGVR